MAVGYSLKNVSRKAVASFTVSASTLASVSGVFGSKSDFSIAGARVGSVSYTHLDVYKRQDCNSGLKYLSS